MWVAGRDERGRIPRRRLSRTGHKSRIHQVRQAPTWRQVPGRRRSHRSRPRAEDFDLILVNSLLHHLDDGAVDGVLAKLAARLGRGHIHIVDLVLPERPRIARRLALWDRGDFPRATDSWKALFARHFEPEARAFCGAEARAWTVDHGLFQGASPRMTADPRVSVAIALFDEEEVFPELLRRLTAVLDALPGGPHEIVFVDDGSRDRTFSLISDAAATDSRVVGLSLSRTSAISRRSQPGSRRRRVTSWFSWTAISRMRPRRFRGS